MHEATSNSMVSQAQRELKQKGFYTGRIDGIDGPKTTMAIRRYQQSENLSRTGTLDQATMSSLGITNPQQSNTGEANRSAEPEMANSPTSGENSPGKLSPEVVRGAQQKLAQDGFYNGRTDGVMNQGTRVAIRQYQKQNNLPVTGRLTSETAQKLGISTANTKFENSNQTPLEQLGKGIAEGAKAPQTKGHNRQ